METKFLKGVLRKERVEEIWTMDEVGGNDGYKEIGKRNL